MTKIKICGLTNLNDALFAAKIGADFLGFIFYEKSPRYIKPAQAQKIISKLPSKVKTVGVFVNQAIAEIKQICKLCNLSYVQLHGGESLDFASQLQTQVIKAFRVKDQERGLNFVSTAFSFGWGKKTPDNVFAYLFDTYVGGSYGGTGQRFDISLIKDKDFDRPFFISGGLTPDNVRNVIDQLHPYGVDVCSGVELSPGKKDPKKLREFIGLVSAI